MERAVATGVKDLAGGARPPTPVRFGKYELLGKIATGGMAEIYLARISGIEGFEKILVVKRILPELAANPGFVQMFLDEARLAATLHHPNIAQVYEAGLIDGQYFFALEHVHGEDLRSLLETVTAQGREVPLGEAMSIIGGVCSGLHYAHEKRGLNGAPLGIVHRDVSLSNVLVTYDGCPKLVDFGIAKAATSKVETRHGSVKGKVSYLSPEQCRCEPLDRRSDIFALGIVLFEITTGRRLFVGGSDFEIMQAIVNAPTPPPSSRRPDYPPELERIVLKALARERAERYQTAQELQLDLEAFARERRLVVSSVALAQFMEDVFAKKISAWRQAQLFGKGLAQHLAETTTTGDLLPRQPAGPESVEIEIQDSPVTKAASPASLGIGRRATPRVAATNVVAAVAARRSRPPLAVLAGLGVIALATAGVFGVRALRGTGTSADVTLQVISEPAGAAVSINGTPQVFVTPATFRVPRAREVALRLDLEGHRPHEERVEISEGQRAKAIKATLVSLTARPSRLRIRTNVASATWRLDGGPVGDGTGLLSLEGASAGAHRVAVEANGFEPRDEVVELPPGGVASLEWTLKPVAPVPKASARARQRGDTSGRGSAERPGPTRTPRVPTIDKL